MDISIKGKHLDIGDALRGHVEDSLDASVRKYFDRALDGTVTFSKESHLFRVDISVHAGRGVVMQGRAGAEDPYAAFDAALDRIAKQLRRYHRRLVNHHKIRGAEDSLPAQYSVIAAEDEDSEVAEDAPPAIVAEMPTEIATLTAGEAVMRMDLADQPVLMFRNRAHGGLNVVYRRADGNIGWIDPVAATAETS
jgi:ribosomal subunit interface protein